MNISGRAMLVPSPCMALPSSRSGKTGASASMVVIHCTLEVPMPKWLMRAGKVMFIAVSTITPQKDMMPVATTAPITLWDCRALLLDSAHERGSFPVWEASSEFNAMK